MELSSLLRKSRDLKIIIGLTALSLAYYIYLHLTYSPDTHSETWLSEVGEFFGEVALYSFFLIYFRTALKLLTTRGSVLERLVPSDTLNSTNKLVRPVMKYLNKTHAALGIFTVALIALHITLVGIPWQVLFFPAVIALVIWQFAFGLFIRWRSVPPTARRFSYQVHSQFITGILIGILAYFGHLVID